MVVASEAELGGVGTTEVGAEVVEAAQVIELVGAPGKAEF